MLCGAHKGVKQGRGYRLWLFLGGTEASYWALTASSTSIMRGGRCWMHAGTSPKPRKNKRGRHLREVQKVKGVDNGITNSGGSVSRVNV